MSVSDDSGVEDVKSDVDTVIERILTSGRKSAGDLKDAVVSVTGISDRVYYRHLRRLVKRDVVEKVVENVDGELTIMYRLKPEVKTGSHPVYWGNSTYAGHLWRLWEVAAHMKADPKGWNDGDADVKEAKSILGSHRSLVPKIVKSDLDPDKFIYSWPHLVEKRYGYKIRKQFPRFFDLKRVYEAKGKAEGISEPVGGSAFLGVNDFEVFNKVGVSEQWQICVVVRRTSNDMFYVVHAEKFLIQGRGDGVSNLRKQFDTEIQRVSESTDEELRREMLFHLREVLDQGRISIPGRYKLLLKDLRLFSFRFTPPPEPKSNEEFLMFEEYLETAGNFVLALAASISCADGLNRRKFLMLKDWFKFL